MQIARSRAARVHGIDLAGPMIELANRHASDSGVARLCTFEVHFYDDDDIARLARAIDGRLTRTIKTGFTPITRDGIARIELS